MALVWTALFFLYWTASMSVSVQQHCLTSLRTSMHLSLSLTSSLFNFCLCFKVSNPCAVTTQAAPPPLSSHPQLGSCTEVRHDCGTSNGLPPCSQRSMQVHQSSFTQKWNKGSNSRVDLLMYYLFLKKCIQVWRYHCLKLLPSQYSSGESRLLQAYNTVTLQPFKSLYVVSMTVSMLLWIIHQILCEQVSLGDFLHVKISHMNILG